MKYVVCGVSKFVEMSRDVIQSNNVLHVLKFLLIFGI